MSEEMKNSFSMGGHSDSGNNIDECNCDSWDKSANQIFDAQAFVESRGIVYTGDVFRYCPWCGVKFEIKQETTA